MVKTLTAKTKKLVESDKIGGGVFTASFLESTIVPVPLEAILVPLMQARRDKLWMIALMATLGCIAGAVLGYALGYYVFDLLKPHIVENWISQDQLNATIERMNKEGFWFVLGLGIAPIPFQIAMLTAGATHFSIPLFVLATGVSRAIRYFGLGLVVYFAGDHAEALIKKYKFTTVCLITLLIGVIWWLKS